MRTFLTLAIFCLTCASASANGTADTTVSRLKTGVALDNVVVYGARNDFGVNSSQMSAVAIGQEQLMSVPVFFGEPDVLKALQKLPGVQTGIDGAAGIFVRGGDYDQNYITLDGSALYNAEHMKGFVSAINPDVVQSVNFYRGAFPARYGSRLSSVVDVGIKAGDFERYHGLLSLGMLSGRVQAEGPIWKGHTSFNIAARMSYFDLIGKPVLEHYYDKPEAMQPYENMSYYDISAKLVHRFNARHTLSAVVYYGNDNDDNAPTRSMSQSNTLGSDEVKLKEQSQQEEYRNSSMNNSWHNLVSSIYWTANFNDRMRLNTNLSFSKYKYNLTYYSSYGSTITDNYRTYYQGFETSNTDYRNEISDMALTADARYRLNASHFVRSGLKLSHQRFTPVTTVHKESSVLRYRGGMNDDPAEVELPTPPYSSSSSTVDYTAGQERNVNSAAFYAEDDFSFFKRFKLNYGLRFAAYFITGKTYLSLEPRAALRFLVTDKVALKASYSRMAQSLHRLVSDNLVSASDIWVPITSDIPLMTSDLYGAGLNWELPWNLQLSVEGYYKTMDNVLEYRNGASYTMSDGNWENMVLLGDGRSYGVELLLERHTGNLTGWVSYTWSKALRKFDRTGQKIDEGREFYASTDRRHNLSATVSQHFDLSNKCMLDLTASWTYQTGRRGTVPSSFITYQNMIEYVGYDYMGEHQRNNYSSHATDIFGTRLGFGIGELWTAYSYKQRNTYQLPAVHHLDVTCTFTYKSKIGATSLGVSVYNVYNRMNVSNVYVGYDDNKLVLKGICPFPIMPSLILTHKF